MRMYHPEQSHSRHHTNGKYYRLLSGTCGFPKSSQLYSCLGVGIRTLDAASRPVTLITDSSSAKKHRPIDWTDKYVTE